VDEEDGLKQLSTRDSKKSARQQISVNEVNSVDSRHQSISQQLVENYLQYAEIMRKDLATSREQQPSQSRQVHLAEVHDVIAAERKTSKDDKSKSSFCQEIKSSIQ